MANIYGKLSSQVYEIDKYIGKSYGDVEYYYERLKETKGKILEPAMGNGRILIPLLKKGLDIEGFDFSDEMLILFEKNCSETGVKSQINKMDMTDFSLHQKYEAIIIPTGSFLIVHERSKSINALKCFYEHLEEKGKLILDIFLPKDFNKGVKSKRTFNTPQGGEITLKESLVEVDYINQFSIFHNQYEKWSNGKLMDSELEVFPLRWYGIEEFRLVLEKLGFKEIVISSDYHYSKYPTIQSEIVTFEAIKG